MTCKSTIFLVFVLSWSAIFAQTRLNGGYDEEIHKFILADTGILIGNFSNGRAAFYLKSEVLPDYKKNCVGFIDTTGKIVVKPVYMNCSDFSGGFALVQDTANGQGLIDRSGKIIIPLDQHQYIQLCENGLLVIEKEYWVRAVSSWQYNISIVNNKGETIIPFGIYSGYATPPPPKFMLEGDDVGHREFRWNRLSFNVSVFFKDYIGVKKGQQWAVINSKGKEIIPPKFDWIGIFNKGMAPVKIDAKYGVIDTAGNLVIPPLYENTALTPGNFVIVTNKKNRGYFQLPISY